MTDRAESIENESKADPKLNPSGLESSAKNNSRAIVDSLLECLVYVADTEGLHCTRASLVSGLPLVDNRVTPEVYARAARRIGLATQIVQRNLSEVSGLVLPLSLIHI